MSFHRFEALDLFTTNILHTDGFQSRIVTSIAAAGQSAEEDLFAKPITKNEPVQDSMCPL
jgi:hypothetical protein